MEDYLKKYNQDRNEEVKKAKETLKEIYTVLKKRNITKVEVEYDGSGDSGSIEQIMFYQGRNIVILEDNNTLPVLEQRKVIEEKIEDIVYTLLPGGWEINEGSYGTFEIDIKNTKAFIKHNENIMDTKYSEEEISL